MKNQFNYNRLQLLIKRQWLENKKLFLMAIGVLFGLGILAYGLTTHWRMAILETQPAIFLIGLFMGGVIFSNFIFKDYSEKNSSSSFLVLPASHFEKLIAGVFFSLIVFPIIFLIIFFIIDFSFVSYINVNHIKLLENNKNAILNWQANVPFFNQIIKRPGTDIQILIGFLFVTQTFTILGSIIFGRWSIIKTAICGFVIFLSLGFLSISFSKMIIGDLFENMDGNKLAMSMKQVKPTLDVFAKVLAFFVIIVLPTALLMASYFKLKEKQV